MLDRARQPPFRASCDLPGTVRSSWLDGIRGRSTLGAPRSAPRLSPVALALAFVVAASPARAQLFQQDFSSSSTLSTYINASTPTTGQWNAIGVTGSGSTVAIVGNALQIAHTGNIGGFARSTDLAPIPASLLYQFDITVTGNSLDPVRGGDVQVGSAFTTTIARRAAPAATPSSGINQPPRRASSSSATSPNTTNSSNLSGTQHITWAMNNSGAALTYAAPNGTQESLANDRMDVWAGTTKVFDDVAVEATGQTISDLKFSFTNGTGTITLDNFLVNSITPLQDAAIFPAEYGVHADGQNQQTTATGYGSGSGVWYMSWDNNNLYVGIGNAPIAQGAVLYLDKDPQTPIDGGTNANGNRAGFLYDGTNFAALPFRADLVVYFKSGAREYRTANGSGGWSAATTGAGAYGENAGTSTREISIPWSAIGAARGVRVARLRDDIRRPVYATVPAANPGGTIGTSARDQRYYAVGVSTPGSETKPFARDCFVFNHANESGGARSACSTSP
jgi:hypothetical protein